MRIRRTPDGEAAAAAPTARAVRRALPPAGQLRRERRALMQVREQRLRDLGGLILEMYRRDQFRQDLLVDRCVELQRLEERLADLHPLPPPPRPPPPAPPPGPRRRRLPRPARAGAPRRVRRADLRGLEVLPPVRTPRRGRAAASRAGIMN